MMMAKEIQIGSNWLDSRGSDNLFTVGRLKPGVSAQQAEAALTVLTAQLEKEHPKDNAGRGVRLIPPGLFIPSIRDSVFAFSSVLAVVGGLVLLLACVNLANLLLARATERRKEIAIRLAVGASRWRLVRQLLTESVMLSVAGGGLGLLLAGWITHAVSSLQLPTEFTFFFDVRIDGRVLAFTLALSLFTGVLFSLIPALQSSRPDLVPSLKEEGSLAGFRRSRLRNALVILQIALSLVLLISAGLIVRSLQAAQHLRPGFNPEHAASVSFDVALQGYDEAKGRAFYKSVLEHARALPGVISAALKEQTQKLDPGLTIYVAKTLEEHMDIPLFPARMAASALGSFGILALILAAVGIYGVMCYVVVGRTREIGLRMALGAQTGNIRRLILRQGMLLAGIGALIGLAVSFGATRLLGSLLYGVSAVDLTTFAVVTFLLGTVALLACWFPAHRATRVDPMVALRAE